MADNTVEQKGGRKVSKKALAKSFHNWYYGNLTCFSQEHMQTFGYLVSMLPIVEDLYDKKEDQTRAGPPDLLRVLQHRAADRHHDRRRDRRPRGGPRQRRGH